MSRAAWSARGFGFSLDADVRLLPAADRGRPESIHRPCRTRATLESRTGLPLPTRFVPRSDSSRSTRNKTKDRHDTRNNNNKQQKEKKKTRDNIEIKWVKFYGWLILLAQASR